MIPSLNFKVKVFSLSMHRSYSSSFRDTTWWSGVIDSTFTYNGCKTVLHMQNTWVKLDEPSMYRHGLGTLEIERSNVNHIVDMINCNIPNFQFGMLYIRSSLHTIFYCILVDPRNFTQLKDPRRELGISLFSYLSFLKFWK